jgi:hypothetical protein
LTTYIFTESGKEFLSKGQQHNFYFKQKNRIETIAIEARTATSYRQTERERARSNRDHEQLSQDLYKQHCKKVKLAL